MNKRDKFWVGVLIIFLVLSFICIIDLARACDYFETRDGVTKQIHPEEDWPAVVDFNKAEPNTTRTVFIWIDYDLHRYSMCDTDGDSFIIYVVDIERMTGQDWASAGMVHIAMGACATLMEALNESMMKTMRESL